MSTKPPEPSPAQTAEWWAEALDVHAVNPRPAFMQLARIAYAAGWNARGVVKESLTAGAPTITDPTHRQIMQMADEVGITDYDAAARLVRLTLAVFRPAPVPVPLRKRWSDRGWPESSDCDAQGRLWCSMGGATWELRQIHSMDTHWLPARALPLPSREATNG